MEIAQIDVSGVRARAIAYKPIPAGIVGGTVRPAINEAMTKGGGAAIALDECGWLGDTLYRSTISANVYTPEQYPAGWEAVTA